MLAQDPLLVVEHRLSTRTHATVNAAFLLAARHAGSGARVVFASDPGHATFVDEVLRRHGEGLDRPGLEFQPLPAPRPAHLVGRTPFLIDRARTLGVLHRIVRRIGPSGALFCSAATADLIIIGRLVARSVPALVVIHELNRLATSAPSAAPLRQALRAARAKRLRMVVLGPSVLEGLRQIDPRLSRNCRSVPMPCLPHDLPGPAFDAPPAAVAEGLLPAPTTEPRPVRFGRMGGDGRGGADTFLAVAGAVRRCTPAAQFVMVGSTGRRGIAPEVRAGIEGYSETTLPYDEYCRRAASVDYAVWAGDPAEYQLTASASVVDAVAFGKPVIALRNPFTEWLFETFGTVGCLCTDASGMVDAVVSRAAQGLADEYLEEAARVRRAQAYFSTQHVGGLLRDEFERLRGIPSRT